MLVMQCLSGVCPCSFCACWHGMCSVVDWGIAPPSYAKMQSCASPQLTHADVRWATKMKKKESILLAFNQVVKLDRVMYDILDALDDVSDLQALPEVPFFFFSLPFIQTVLLYGLKIFLCRADCFCLRWLHSELVCPELVCQECPHSRAIDRSRSID